MNIEKYMLVDPKSKLASVSFTLLGITTVLVFTVGLLHVFDVIKSVGIFLELQYSSLALYFGRNLKIGSKEGLISQDKQEEVK